MKKKLSKLDIVILVSFVVGSMGAIIYEKSVFDGDRILHPIPLSIDEIKKLSNNDSRAVVIYPILTQIAYKQNGFYDYYKGNCPTCTTISMRPLGINPNYNTGSNSFDTLLKLHYQFITDIMVDRHPELLKDYDTIILLHNEYMTQTEFNAISHHKNVVYLYPNSMYALVSVDYKKWEMTLIRGHGYPEKNISNGFNYVTSSQNEYDINCKNYKWLQMPNGIEISCFPELLVTYDRSPMQTIKDYPTITPPLIPMNTTYYNMSGFQYCYPDGHCGPPPNGKWNS